MRTPRALLCLAACAVLASCQGAVATAKSPSPRPPRAASMMSPTEARARMTGLLDDTFTAIVPGVKYRDGWPHAIENDEPAESANAYLDRYVTTRISASRYGALLGLVERRWKDRGYRIETVNADTRMPAITARAPDGAVLHLTVGHPGNITFTAAVTPIALPADHTTGALFGPEPPQPTLPNGNPDILPNLDDPFWSH